MSAEIIRLADVRMRRSGGQSNPGVLAEAEATQETSPRFHFWSGASGRRYVHTVYSVFDCPPLEDANYILVQRSDKSARTVLAIGRLFNQCAMLNLAEIRHHASVLGADEVHVHLLAASSQEAQAVEADLITAQFSVGPCSA
jgi:hypothetical protein